MKHVEFEATVCSDNSFHEDHSLSSMRQVCIAPLGMFQSISHLDFSLRRASAQVLLNGN